MPGSSSASLELYAEDADPSLRASDDRHSPEQGDADQDTKADAAQPLAPVSEEPAEKAPADAITPGNPQDESPEHPKSLTSIPDAEGPEVADANTQLAVSDDCAKGQAVSAPGASEEPKDPDADTQLAVSDDGAKGQAVSAPGASEEPKDPDADTQLAVSDDGAKGQAVSAPGTSEEPKDPDADTQLAVSDDGAKGQAVSAPGASEGPGSPEAKALLKGSGTSWLHQLLAAGSALHQEEGQVPTGTREAPSVTEDAAEGTISSPQLDVAAQDAGETPAQSDDPAGNDLPEGGASADSVPTSLTAGGQRQGAEPAEFEPSANQPANHSP